VQKRFRYLTGIAMTAVFTVVAMTWAAPSARAQAAPQKKVKDQGEFDLYNSVIKEPDAGKKLGLLDQWVQKYPDTDFKEERLQIYNSIKQPAKVVEVGTAILGKDPKNLTALVLVCANTPLLTEPTAEQMANGQKAAKYLLENIDALKPAAVADDAWKQAKAGIEANANAALTFVTMFPGNSALAKKDFAGAEAAFKKILADTPNNGQVAYAIGSAIISQKKVDRYPEAFFYVARALAIDPDKGGLPDATRKQVEPYLTKIYTNYHGEDAAGLAQLKEVAKANTAPPADFKVKSMYEVAEEKEKEFREKNPQLALWLGIKKELAGANGEQYFAANVKDADVPKLKGTLIEAKPASRSKELILGLENADAREVTLKLAAALTGKPKLGTVIEFKGVPSAFTKEPFMVTFDTEKADITGLEMEAAPAPVKKAVPKKSAPKKK
jgi:tetratricopeptide (TPR) repeat protein